MKPHSLNSRLLRLLACMMPLAIGPVFLDAACSSTPAARPTAAAPSLPLYSAESVQRVFTIEKMRGRFVAAVAVAQAGRFDTALLHVVHPGTNNFAAIEPALGGIDAGLAKRATGVLAGNATLLSGKSDAKGFEAVSVETNKLFDEIARALIPSIAFSNLVSQSQTLADLLSKASDEYVEAVVGGIVKDPEEYEDAYGFFQRVRVLWQDIEGQVKAKAAHVYAEIEDLLDLLKTASLEVAAPTAPIAPAEVRTWSEAVAHELDEITGYQPTAAPAADAMSPAEELMALVYELDDVFNALRANDVKAAAGYY